VPQTLKGKFTAVVDFKADPFEVTTKETSFTIQ
jgi:hypothetical protein